MNRVRCEARLRELSNDQYRDSEKIAGRRDVVNRQRFAEADNGKVSQSARDVENEQGHEHSKLRLSDDGNDKPVDGRANANSEGAEKGKTDTHREAVNQRLRDLAAFERRASGLNKKRTV
jgi:hypothetical protein